MNFGRIFATIFQAGRRYGADRRGAAAAEFGIFLAILVIPIANVTDLGIYVYQRMELENAAQVAVQTAWATCILPANLPATPNSYANCPALPAAITTAVRSTSLGSAVSATATTEGYYCVNTTTNALVTVGTFPGTKPANCSSVGSASDTVGDYIQIQASYTYAPLFPAVSVVSLLGTTITRTAWMRLG
jgi:Flp pilus assembly protein TadG